MISISASNRHNNAIMIFMIIITIWISGCSSSSSFPTEKGGAKLIEYEYQYMINTKVKVTNFKKINGELTPARNKYHMYYDAEIECLEDTPPEKVKGMYYGKGCKTGERIKREDKKWLIRRDYLIFNRTENGWSDSGRKNIYK